jgi:hypothetical protein
LLTKDRSNICRKVSSSAGFDPVLRVHKAKFSNQFSGRPRFGDVSFGSPKPLPIMPTIFVACIGEIVHRHFFRAIVSLPYGTKYSVTVHAVSVRETSTFPTSVHRLASFVRLGRAA